jgi:hypothetical protein
VTRSWSRRDEHLLRSIYPWLPISEVAETLERTEKGVRSRAKVLGVKRVRENYRKWTRREEKILRVQYPDVFTEKIAKLLRRPIFVIYQHAAKLGLEKSAAYIAAKKKVEAERLTRAGVAHRYPKGHPPANKGLRRPGYAPGRMASTQFKKGQQPHNTMPLWSFRWYCGGSDNTPGYMLVKTGKPGPKPLSGWEFVHKLVWEHANGPIPPGHRIWWKNRNHADCSLSNLELLSDVEHMRRTTVHNLPKPLVEVIQLTGALKRKIRTAERKLHGAELDRGSSQSSVRSA